MSPALHPAALPPRYRRALLWVALVALLAVAQSLLVWLTLSHEDSRRQEQVESVAGAAAADVKLNLGRNLQSLQALLWSDPALDSWSTDAGMLLRQRPELLRIERRDVQYRVQEAVDSPFQAPVFTRMSRSDIDVDVLLACVASERLLMPSYSRSYFVPFPDGMGLEVMDVCIPIQQASRSTGFLTATIALGAVLQAAATTEQLRDHEMSFVEGDGTRLARVGVPRGAGVYLAERLVDLPGSSLQLRVDSQAGAPRLIPNLAVALVLGLSLALSAVVGLLVHDMRRRAKVEAALDEALAFRKAMENSLITGLRARDMEGRVTYVNPAFCRMVGFSAEEIVGLTQPPYWPADLAAEYSRRQVVRLSAQSVDLQAPGKESREGFETTFLRSNGERIAVLIFEAPLIDGAGRHTGWMGAILDVSQQRRIEDLSRQQHERLAATARLATVGEMASLLSHELNQPLAAIASYATGSLNLMTDQPPDAGTAAMLRQATERIAEQAERAGRVIKSVHDFVRRREQLREPVRVETLIDAVLPLVRLQARKSGARIEVTLAPRLPRAVCDRTMVEQVLLNLTRNGIQAMDDATPLAQRELQIKVQTVQARWISFQVIDHGPGVPDDVAQRLFTPFFTTRSEGMGLGLSLCRTVIEQHGGALDFSSQLANGPDGAGRTEFRFTLPAEAPPRPAVSNGAESAEARLAAAAATPN